MSKMNNSILDLLSEFSADFSKRASATDDGTVPAKEGARSAENSADVKRNVKGPTVDETEEIHEVAGAGVNTPTNSIGAKSAPTGEDVPSTKSTKDDPGTSHPAKAGGEKYASIDSVINLGNDLLAKIAVAAASSKSEKSEKQAEMPPQLAAAVAKRKASGKGEAKAEETPADNGEVVAVKKAEYEQLVKQSSDWQEFLGYVYGQNAVQEMMGKEAADAADADAATAQPAVDDAAFEAEAEKIAAEVIARADQQTSDLIEAVVSFHNQSVKQAMDPAMAGAVDPAALAGGGAPAPAAGGGGEDIDPQTMMALLEALQAQGINPEELMAAEGALGAGGEGGGDAIDAAQANMAGGGGGEDPEAKEEVSNEPKDKAKAEDSAEKEAQAVKLAEVFTKFVKKAAENAKAKNNKKK